MKKIISAFILVFIIFMLVGCKIKKNLSFKLNDGSTLFYTHTSSETLFAFSHVLKVTKNFATTKVNNDEMSHQFFAMEISKNKKVELVPWAIMKNGHFQLNNIMQVALDYEYRHPGKIVVGAINYSFYDIKRKQATPGIMDGYFVENGRVYKPTSHRFDGLAFLNGEKKSLIPISRKNIKTDKYVLKVLENDKVVHEESLILNKEGGNAFFPYRTSENNWVYPEVKNAFLIKNAQKFATYDKDNLYLEGVCLERETKTLLKNEIAINTSYNLLGKKVIIEPVLKINGKLNPYKYLGDLQHKILINKKHTETWQERHPRTFIGMRKNGEVVLFVLDGRQAKYKGAKTTEMAAICKSFNLIDAYNFDGGGSSTMIIRKKESKSSDFILINKPSDGQMRLVSNCLLVVMKAEDFK